MKQEYEQTTNIVDQVIFTLKIICMKNLHGVKFRSFVRLVKFFLRLTVTMWTSAWRVPSVQSTTRYQESQVWLVVYSCRSDIYFGGVDSCAHLSIDHCHTSFFFTCLIFVVGIDRKIFLTSKFSRSTVFKGWRKHRPQSEEVLAYFRSVFLQLQLVSMRSLS